MEICRVDRKITHKLGHHSRTCGTHNKMETMHEIDAIIRPTVLFTHTNNLKPTELADAESNPTEKHQDNGATPPLNTQPSSP